jgi:hypothetical protein
LEGQSDLPFAGVFHDDLRKDDVGEVLAGTTIHHSNFDSIANHASYVFELDVAAGAGVVEPAVTVFADEDFGVFHGRLQRPKSSPPKRA